MTAATEPIVQTTHGKLKGTTDKGVLVFRGIQELLANVRDHAGRLEHDPKFVTAAKSGAGFVELAELLIARAHR